MATIGAGGAVRPSGRLPKGLIIGILAVFAAVVVAVIATLAVTSNGSSSATADKSVAQAPAVSNANQQTGQAQTSSGNFTRPANSVRIGEFLIAVTSVKTPSDIKPPETHLKYVVIELTVQNVGTLANKVGSDDEFFLFDSDGVKASIFSGSTERSAAGELGKKVEQSWGAPPVDLGQTVERTLVYKILKDAKPARLEFSNRDTGARGTIPLK